MSEYVLQVTGAPTVQVQAPSPLVVSAPGPQGSPGSGGGAVDLAAHVNSPTPHPAYDTDLQSLQVLFENGLA